MEKKLIVVLGSASVDFNYSVQRHPLLGETVDGKLIQINSGGKAANQAATSGLMGLDTYFVAQVGKDEYGQMSINDLKSRGVNTDGMRQLEGIQTGKVKKGRPSFSFYLTGRILLL